MKSLIGLLLFFCSSLAFADISVTHARAAATAPGQQVGGAYLDISASENAKLVGVESPVARKVMIHVMTMKNGIMEMRSVKTLDIPAGKTVSLSEGGMHLMLMDIRKPLVSGDTVPLRLTFDQDGKQIVLNVGAKVTGMGMDMH